MTTEQLKELEKLNERWANEHLETSADFNDLLTAVMDLIPDVLAHIKQLSELIDKANHIGYGNAVTLQIERIQAERDRAQADRDLNIEEHAIKCARLEAERDAAERACAEMRDAMECDDDDVETWNHALSSDCGKGYHHDDEWKPVVEALKRIKSKCNEPKDPDKIADIWEISKQALAHAAKLMEGQ